MDREGLNALCASTKLELREDDRGLALVGDGLELRGDFSRMAHRIKPHNLHQELVVRAAKIKGAHGVGLEAATAIDATAGLGEDSFLLAAAGFSVQLYEHNPVIAALLADALRRAAQTPQLAEVVGRMHLVEADSVAALAQLTAAPDVVLLDPMFPARRKSASVKKKLQLLQRLETPCENEEALLQAALAAHPKKVVIKRPPKGPYLAGIKPSYSLEGKAVRYDCIALP